ncbi:MAG: adenosine kinase [Bacteroidales bacterium]|nr:adenosine kinase [Bacteroidales bacterium]
MPRVLGMGNALLDMMTLIEDDQLLESLQLPKGSMQLVDNERSMVIRRFIDGMQVRMASGGSAANTIHGLAQLGIETGFIGKIGNDDHGRFFREDLIKSRINPLLFSSETPTGMALALVSRDSERTFATYLGAAIELSEKDITPELFGDYSLFHIEGYLVQTPSLFETALRMASEKGMITSLDLASFNVVEQHRDYLLDILGRYIDVVFANEEEAKTISGREPEDALQFLADLCDTAVVKVGSKGSMFRRKQEMSRAEAVPARCIDTTGAGDLYAAGFLYGMINGYNLHRCGAIGSLVSGKVIEVVGPKMESEHWEEIRHQIGSM